MGITSEIYLFIIFQGLYMGSYGEEWAFTFPSKIQALYGSCVQIPCSFTHPNYFSQPKVKWYKIEGNVNNELERRSQIPVMTDLPSDCTLKIDRVTREDEGEYYLGISTSINAYEIGNKTVQLDLTDVPVRISLSIPTKIIKGNITNFTCSADHTCAYKPPSLKWNIIGVSVSEDHVDFGDGKFRVISKLTYEPSYKDQGKKAMCRITHPNRKIYRRERTLNIESPSSSDDIPVLMGSLAAVINVTAVMLVLLIYNRKRRSHQSSNNEISITEGAQPTEATYTDLTKRDKSAEYDVIKPKSKLQVHQQEKSTDPSEPMDYENIGYQI